MGGMNVRQSGEIKQVGRSRERMQVHSKELKAQTYLIDRGPCQTGPLNNRQGKDVHSLKRRGREGRLYVERNLVGTYPSWVGGVRGTNLSANETLKEKEPGQLPKCIKKRWKEGQFP